MILRINRLNLSVKFSKETILNVLKESKPFLVEEMGVKRIGLFGSYAKNLQSADSDIDIFMELEENNYKKILEVLLFLENRLQNKIDLVYRGPHLRDSFVQTL